MMQQDAGPLEPLGGTDDRTAAAADWPVHTRETRPWQQQYRGGTREDRTLDRVEVALPPWIATLDYHLDPRLGGETERAVYDIAYTEGAAGRHLGALGRFLIQTESVSSSKIEQVEASTEDFARALAGSRSNASATSMVAATQAVTDMVDAAGSGVIDREALLRAHSILMRDDPIDGPYAGAVRPMQNWIGGSDYSPRNAIHVPPPPELVEDYLDDLLHYANRDDVPVIVQAAVVHAQFESIHPFTDGNGRIGRALINAVFRRRGLTRATVVPIATAMVAERDTYFRLVNEYRNGHLGQFVRNLADSAIIAAEESRRTADRFSTLPQEWADRVRVRGHSAAAALLPHLLEKPVLSAEDALALTGGSLPSLYGGLDRLTEAGIVREITGRQRNRVWAANDVMAELDDLSNRIALRVKPNRI